MKMERFPPRVGDGTHVGGRAYHSAVQPHADATTSTIWIGTAAYDPFGIYDHPNNRFLCPNGLEGYWQFIGSIQWPTNVNGDRWGCIRHVEGGFYIAQKEIRAGVSTSQIILAGTHWVSAGHTVELRGWHNAGTSLDIPNDTSVFLEATWKGRSVP